MALDHYTSQVYLRRFLAAGLGNRMYAMRKSDLQVFTPRPRDVCRIEEGNTNKYLEDERAIEKFLLDVEPKFNDAADRFVKGVPDPEHIFAVSGLVGYFLTCSPAALRINAEPARSHVKAAAILMDKEGLFSDPPASLGPGSLSEMLNDGRLEMEVDVKFPGAIGVANILGRVSLFGNSFWDILLNDNTGCEFFTSDFPVAVERGDDPSIVCRIVPISPNVAVRIIPDRLQSRKELDLDFKNFRYRKLTISAAEARRINQLIVKCAEDSVFAPDWNSWRQQFVEKHRRFRVDTVTHTSEVPNGTAIHHRMEIVRYEHQQK